jgi:ribosomal protein S18 acetylase RimI-like enzyme
MRVEHMTKATAELSNALQRLIPQLTDRGAAPSEQQLAALMASSSSALLVVREGKGAGAIVAVGGLGVYHAPTGVKAVIEDVVVDGQARNRGVGEALLRGLVDLAREKGAQAVALTSNPKRQAANRLYARLGFKLRRTNAYYLDLL